MTRQTYGTLTRVDDETVEFTVDGRLVRAWKLRPPVTDTSRLFQQCLSSLGHEGWRPLSHQSSQVRSVVLGRVPYAAGTKLSTFGVLRFLGDGSLALSVAGSIMRTWPEDASPAELMSRALSSLELEGWRVHRRYRRGATVVRG